MTWDGSVPTFAVGKVSATDLQELADIATHLAQFMTDGAWSTWTPTWGGGGTATFAPNSGRYKRIAPRTVVFQIYALVNVAGSGASNVTFTLPSDPTRAARHIFQGGHEAGADLVGLYAVAFTSGSGAAIDRIRYNGDTNVIGTDLTASRYLQFSGVYEEAS